MGSVRAKSLKMNKASFVSESGRYLLGTGRRSSKTDTIGMFKDI